jgi:hypothetical protein
LPDAAQELSLADHRPRGLDERHQHVESAAAERYRPAIGEQLAVMRRVLKWPNSMLAGAADWRSMSAL